MGGFSPTLTAWSGPWGVSFSANLTPDPETGRLRDFTEQQFIQTLAHRPAPGSGAADPSADALAVHRAR